MTERNWKKRPKKLGKLDENKEFFQEKAVNSLLYSIAVSYGESNPMEKSFELIRELTQQKTCRNQSDAVQERFMQMILRQLLFFFTQIKTAVSNV